MSIVWNTELIVATGAILLIFLLAALWAKSATKVVFLLIGFAGLWLAIADPLIGTTMEKKAFVVDDIQSFLTGELKEKTDTVILPNSTYNLEDISLLDDFYVKYEAEEEQGIVLINYKSIVEEGERFEINGKIEGSSIKRIRLTTPDGDVQEGEIEDSDLFKFVTVAPVKGLYEYQLEYVNASLDTSRNTLPLEVIENSELNLLIFASSPQFDLNYLKNYWVEKGHGFAQKVKISKDKFNNSFINLGERNLSTLNSKALDDFSILLVDLPMWNALSSRERSVVLSRIENHGLGLMIKPTDVGQSAKDLPFHKVLKFEDLDVEATEVSMVSYDFNRNWQSSTFALHASRGYGNIAMLKILDSYKLILSDQSSVYENLWADLFSDLHVSVTEGLQINVPFLIFENQKTSLRLSGISQQSELLLNDREVLKINFTPLVEGYGEARVYPQKGWNSITEKGSDKKIWFYSHPKGSWRAMHAQNTEDFVDLMHLRSKEKKISPTYKIKKSLPFYWSLLLVIIGFGFVWFKEKVDF